MITWRAVVNIGTHGSWSQGGFLSRFDAQAAARQYITDHPEIKDRAVCGKPELDDPDCEIILPDSLGG